MAKSCLHEALQRSNLAFTQMVPRCDHINLMLEPGGIPLDNRYPHDPDDIWTTDMTKSLSNYTHPTGSITEYDKSQWVPPKKRRAHARRCPNCSYVLPSDARFCEHCGTPVLRSGRRRPAAKARFCHICGQRLLPGSSFCDECGTKTT